MAIRPHVWVSAALLLWASTASAQITRIVVDTKVSPAFDGTTFGAAGQYETLAGRAFGELDPNDPLNAIITDIRLAPRNARGRVEYIATFFLVKPIDLSKSSHLMWHDVPNRGNRVTIGLAERAFGDIGLSSGWQGDNAGNTVPGSNNDYLIAPVAKNPDGSPVTGLVMGRIANASGQQSQQMFALGSPLPYKPLTLDTTKATLTTHASETIDGKIGPTLTIPSSDWAWARCSAANPFPGTPDSAQVCLKRGFDPKLLYQVVFTAKDPYVLGIGFAAFRDMAAFFRHAERDDSGTPNPLARSVSWVIARGASQSGNFLRAFIQLGFTEDLSHRPAFDGAWPYIAGRRISLNTRFATPDAALKLYDAGSEGPLWWAPWPDPVRKLPTAGILDRCERSKTCPRIIEHFGAAEIWDLNLSPGFVGTSADKDIPLPANVRRYYIPGTPHGGGRGGFSVSPLAPPSCPGPNFGTAVLPTNPLPHTETVNALRAHFRDWVMKGTPPPASVWPTLSSGLLVDPTKEALGFPTLPGLPATAPTGLMNPVRDYDWGPGFNYVDGSGVRSIVPPIIKQVIKMKAVRVDADGNELGGVPVVLRDAPLGTYLGWNIVAGGFFEGQICNYAGGMIPFAVTKAERLAASDPRLSLEERYTNHDGYVAAVRKAAAAAVQRGFLLEEDAQRLIAGAASSSVLVSRSDAVQARQVFADRYYNTFSHANPVLARVKPGEFISTKTLDASGRDDKGTVRAQPPNPLTGPFYVEGAEPGDAVIVRFTKVRMNRNWGFSSYRLGLYALTPETIEGLYPNRYRPNEIVDGRAAVVPWDLDLDGQTVRLREPSSTALKLTFPAKPMLGCVGVAPAGDFAPTSSPAGSYGGNLDYNEIREGTSVLLPVFHPGALVFIGDGHALQADGEPTGTGIETSMDVEFTIEVRKKAGLSGPRVETPEHIISIGSQPEFVSSTNRALEMATSDMVSWLTAEYRTEPWAAHLLIGAVGRYDIITVAGSVGLKIPKSQLPQR